VIGATAEAGRQALRQGRLALRWKRVELGGSIALAAMALGAGAALLVAAALHMVGTVVGAIVGLLLGSLGGLMLSAATDAWRDVRKLDGGDLPRARLARVRVARPPDPDPKNLV